MTGWGNQGDLLKAAIRQWSSAVISLLTARALREDDRPNLTAWSCQYNILKRKDT